MQENGRRKWRKLCGGKAGIYKKSSFSTPLAPSARKRMGRIMWCCWGNLNEASDLLFLSPLLYTTHIMDQLSTLSQNMPFLADVYSLTPALAFLVALVVADLVLKAWAMWRAARMEKKAWFIGLLIINSIGILPVIFLLMTRDEYAKIQKKMTSTTETELSLSS
jgi:hypothetical protein